MRIDDDVAEAQAVRDRQLADNSLSADDIAAIEQVLNTFLAVPEIYAVVSNGAIQVPLFTRALRLTIGWFSGEFEKEVGSRMKAQGTDISHLMLPRTTCAQIVLFRETVYRCLVENDLWNVVNTVCDIQPLKEYADGKCRNLDLDETHFFFHDAWSKTRQPKTDNWDNSKQARILLPMYEGVILGFVFGLVIAVAGVEYARWRDGKSEELHNRVQELEEKTKKLYERIEELERQSAERITTTANIVTVLIAEAGLRKPMIYDQIPDDPGVIDHDSLAELYIDDLLPTLKEIRESQGEAHPEKMVEEFALAEVTADKILPRQCMAKTTSGDRCSRLTKAGQNRCWQHGGSKDVARVRF